VRALDRFDDVPIMAAHRCQPRDRLVRAVAAPQLTADAAPEPAAAVRDSPSTLRLLAAALRAGDSAP
jgi:hypothetical protein